MNPVHSSSLILTIYPTGLKIGFTLFGLERDSNLYNLSIEKYNRSDKTLEKKGKRNYYLKKKLVK